MFNLTIDDTSPLFVYSQYGEGLLSLPGWATYYDGSGFFAGHNDGDVGSGTTYHVAQTEGATVTLEFYGTSITVYGQTNCTYEIVVDQQAPIQGAFASGSSTIFEKSGLSTSNHTITISPHPGNSQAFMLDRAEVQVDTGSGSWQANIFPNTDSRIKKSGNWAVLRNSHIPSSQIPAPYSILKDAGMASLTFGGFTAVAITGSVNFTGGTYTTSIGNTLRTYNGSSTWLVPDTLLFFEAGLDPLQNFTVSIAGHEGQNLWLNEIALYSEAPGGGPASTSTSSDSGSSPPSQHSSTPVIVGSVLGAVAFLALIFGALLYIYRRSRRRTPSQRSEQEKPLRPHPSITPFTYESGEKTCTSIDSFSTRDSPLPPTPIPTPPVSGKRAMFLRQQQGSRYRDRTPLTSTYATSLGTSSGPSRGTYASGSTSLPTDILSSLQSPVLSSNLTSIHGWTELASPLSLNSSRFSKFSKPRLSRGESIGTIPTNISGQTQPSQPDEAQVKRILQLIASRIDQPQTSRLPGISEGATGSHGSSASRS